MGTSGKTNPFVRRFMIRHWRKQKKLADRSEPVLPAEWAPDPLEKEKVLGDEKKEKDRVIIFISDEAGDKLR